MNPTAKIVLVVICLLISLLSVFTMMRFKQMIAQSGEDADTKASTGKLMIVVGVLFAALAAVTLYLILHN